MRNGFYKCDFHNHPLSHKYYPANKYMNRNLTIGKKDKQRIEEYIHWCIDVRKLDVVAITDHDLIQSSLYAREYVETNNLPIKVVTGAECEIYLAINWGSDENPSWKKDCVHLLVLGVDEIPTHKLVLDLDEIEVFIDNVHDLGGIVVMSHPVFSALSFYTIADLLDGFEILNRDKYEFPQGKHFCEHYNIKYKTYKNSDYHYYKTFDSITNPIPESHNYETEEFVNQLFKRRNK